MRVGVVILFFVYFFDSFVFDRAGYNFFVN